MLCRTFLFNSGSVSVSKEMNAGRQSYEKDKRPLLLQHGIKLSLNDPTESIAYYEMVLSQNVQFVIFL